MNIKELEDVLAEMDDECGDMYDGTIMLNDDWFRSCIQRIRAAALDAPQRQCDVGTPDEQSARFDAHCQKHMGCLTCPLREKDGSVPKHCEFAWGAMTYEKGGAK